MSSTGFNRLRYRLGELVRKHGLVAIKTGTEVEDMSFEEIYLLKEMSKDILPIYVKIGGPEARNDIRELTQIGVSGLIAPMIESVYALRNFIQTLKDILGPAGYHKIQRGINLETITGFKNMNEIFASDEARELHQITAARSDLSGSMNLKPDDLHVLEVCSIIVARARENDLKTSVGGSIHAGIAKQIIEIIHPHTINTRHMVLDCEKIEKQAAEKVNLNLEFEADLYSYLSSLPTPRQKSHSDRAKVIRTRLESLIKA